MDNILHFLAKNLRRTRSGPLYIHLANLLERAIVEGITADNEFLPTERLLAEKLKTSRVTVSKALALLEQKGAIQRRQGIGTVITPRIGYSLDYGVGFTEQVELQGGSVSNQWLLKTKILANSQISRWLELNEGDQVAHLRRIRLVNGCPASLENTYVPLRFLPDPEQLENSLFKLWQAQGITVQHTHNIIRALACSHEIAVLLNIKANSPVLLSWQTSRNANKEILEFNESFCRADLYEFEASR